MFILRSEKKKKKSRKLNDLRDFSITCKKFNY